MFVFLWFMLVLLIIVVGFIVLYVSLKHYWQKDKASNQTQKGNKINESSIQ